MATKGRGKNWSVLHTLLDTSHPEQGPTSQTFYLSTTPIMGFQPRTFWVCGMSGTQKFNEVTVVAPASDNAAIEKQEHTIGVDVSGAIGDWSIVNPDAGDVTLYNNGENFVNRADTTGRRISMALTFTTPSDFYAVSSVSKAASAVVTLADAHGIQVGKSQKIVLAGCNGTADISVDGTRIGTATGATTMTIPVNTSTATGSYAAGTAEFVMDHNPTQDGSGVPPTNTAETIKRSVPLQVVQPGTTDKIVVSCVPLEWGPDGTNAERQVYHGGDTDMPVIWPGIQLGCTVEPNCSITVGNTTAKVNGIHRFRSEMVLEHDIELGDTAASGVTPSISIGHPIYMRPSYGRGITAANTRAFIYRTDDLTSLYLDQLTAGWSAGGGHGDELGAGYFFDADAGTLVRSGGSGDATNTDIGARTRAFIAYEISGASFYVGLRMRTNTTMIQWPGGYPIFQYSKVASDATDWLNNQAKDDAPCMILQQYFTFKSGAGSYIQKGRYWFEWYMMTARSQADIVTQALILDAAGV